MTDAPTKPGPVAHRCEEPGCGAYGPFGYGEPPGVPNPKLIRWYCAKHRPGQPAPPAVEPGPAQKKPTQGKLL
ncbi:MAG: hypothetical protein ACRC67_33300 [Inquilinus sp.]|uniref:hypothetical protein n=1 Tax=Inquilinus sp. TaxID=1932117 RepID=UPI003F34FA86